MGEITAIGWTDATVNFWTGCKKVSDGCKFCYMYRDKERYNLDPKQVIRTSDKTFMAALSWKQPKRIFTCSWSDFFIEEADGWRADAWEIIRDTPQHTWQILTKRPERILQCLPKDWGIYGYPNVHIGVSVENEANTWRMWYLSLIPAAVRFVSFEPLIGDVEHYHEPFSKHAPDAESIYFSNESLIHYSTMPLGAFNPKRSQAIDGGDLVDWVIIGGESGNETGQYRYRECKIEWIERLVNYWSPTVPVFIKQMGTHLAGQLNIPKSDRHGSDINNFPKHLQLQQFPKPLK